jgi:hypothetical protein
MVYGNVLDIGTPSDSTVTNAKTNFVSTSSSAGLQIKGDGTTDGTLQLNCSQNSHGIKLKSPPHSASASYTLTFPNDDGSSGEALTTNGSGVLTWASAGGQNTPCFSAYRGGSNQDLSNGADTTIIFSTEDFDPQSTYDTSTGRFTPAVSGKYYLKASILLSASGDQKIHEIYLRKNSTTVGSYRIRGSHDGNMSITVSDIVESDTNDYFYIMLYHNVGSTIQAQTGTHATWFQGFKIIE